jgi:hypothetical protein
LKGGKTVIPEIGIIVGLYVITRLIPSRWKALSIGFAVLTVLVSLLAIADLAIRATSEKSLFSLGEPTGKTQAVGVPVSKGAAPQSVTVTRADGGSITTQLGYGIALSKFSTLRREWIAVHDALMPADLTATPGIATVYISKEYGGEYRYRTQFSVATRAGLRAIKFTFLTFDVWGNHVRTLTYEEVADIPVTAGRPLTSDWLLYSENEAEKHYASIGYVSQVRLADGRVISANEDPIIAEAKKFAGKFTRADLEPENQRTPQPATTPASAR